MRFPGTGTCRCAASLPVSCRPRGQTRPAPSGEDADAGSAFPWHPADLQCPGARGTRKGRRRPTLPPCRSSGRGMCETPPHPQKRPGSACGICHPQCCQRC
ncbi:hypothetical protein FKM82_027129 [Ascaphus truei]